MICTFPSLKIDIEKYPSVKEHLLSFTKHRLNQTGEKGSRKKTNNEWFETQDSISYWEDFQKEKIVFKAIGRNLAFSFAESGILLSAPSSFFTSKLNTRYILAFLQSKVIAYYILKYSDKTGEGDVMLSIQFFEKIPIPLISDIEQLPFIDLVEQLLTRKQKEENTDEIEAKIDNLIFDLFNLSISEIKLIKKITDFS